MLTGSNDLCIINTDGGISLVIDKAKGGNRIAISDDDVLGYNDNETQKMVFFDPNIIS